MNNFLFFPNSSYFLRIQQNCGHENFEKTEKTKKILRDIPKKNWKIRALEKSQVFSFFALRYARVLFKNQRKSEKLWGKPWEFKKRIGDQFRKTVRKWVLRKNLPFSHPRPKTYRKSQKMFEEILRNSDEISKKIWEIFLPGYLRDITSFWNPVNDWFLITYRACMINCVQKNE